MRQSIAVAVSTCMAIQSALAVPAVTTANVNFRDGPGTGYASLGTVPDGTTVELKECDDAGAWCTVTHNGRTGFISGSFLEVVEEAGEPEEGWPRTYTADSGATLVLYQPQFSEWEDFTTLKALIAAEYVKKGGAKPAFGVVGLSGITTSDPERGEVLFKDIAVTELTFSTLERGDFADLALRVGSLIPTGTITIKEERITASLAEYQRVRDVDGLKAEAPPVIIAQQPAILVQTDGAPITVPVRGTQGLSFIVNSNWDILKLGNRFYLRDEGSWLVSTRLARGWRPATTLPRVLQTLPRDENWSEIRAADPPKPFPDDAPPQVFYSDTPAEMIVFDGEPVLEPVPGTGLVWASNTESDVFRHSESGLWYVLLSGRWFSAPSLRGPWTFATADLPTDFLNIPESAAYYSVRASVPGTSDAAQARLKASIPHKARVEIGSITATVIYAGDPEFAPIEGTQMTYAVNSHAQVIKVGSLYYVLQDGVWFVGPSPKGPFEVAIVVPEDIYTIPPSSPVHNVTYVRIYESEPGAVWFGYTMGYLTGYLGWGTVVYGSGWRHQPWVRPGPVPIYFRRPVTYGIGAFFNPVRGAFGRYGYAYGPARGIAAGAVYNPSTGNYIRGPAVSGPAGQRGFIAATNPRTSRGTVVVGGGSGVYESWSAAGVRRGADWARSQQATATIARRWQAQTGSGQIAPIARRNDVYAGRDGAVYRRDGERWQRFAGGRWVEVDRPEPGQLRDPVAIPDGQVATLPDGQRPAPAHLTADDRAREAADRQVNRERTVESAPPRTEP